MSRKVEGGGGGGGGWQGWEGSEDVGEERKRGGVRRKVERRRNRARSLRTCRRLREENKGQMRGQRA